ncbi:hypothetical protein LINPERHAP1_LOCUS11754, partial [Linum perenne]
PAHLSLGCSSSDDKLPITNDQKKRSPATRLSNVARQMLTWKRVGK